MKKLLLVLLLSCIYNQVNADGWTTKANYPDARYGAVSFSIGSFGYLGAGADVGNLPSFHKFDPQINTWTQIQNMPAGVTVGLVAFSDNNYGFVLSGTNLYRYDPSIDSWFAMATFPGSPRQWASSFVIGDKAYVGLGYVGSADFWQYDMTNNTWSSIANFPGPLREKAVAFSVGGKGYIGAGKDLLPGTAYNDFYRYDPIFNTWTAMANIPVVGGLHSMVGFNLPMANSGIIGLGSDINGVLSDAVYEFIPPFGFGGGSWVVKNNFASGQRVNAAAMIIQNKAYMGTGSNVSALNSFYEYIPCVQPVIQTITASDEEICTGEQ
jgi:N-acetylneuraminic acid mutarotase